jgi:hypothetical protein
MKTIKEIITELKQFPEDSLCIAYSDEFAGLSIMTPDRKYYWISTPIENEQIKENNEMH